MSEKEFYRFVAMAKSSGVQGETVIREVQGKYCPFFSGIADSEKGISFMAARLSRLSGSCFAAFVLGGKEILSWSFGKSGKPMRQWLSQCVLKYCPKK